MNSFVKVLGLMALISCSLVQGYAIVYDKDSPVPYVDVYLYNVNSVEAANKKHANYGRAVGLPETIVKVLEVGRKPSEAVAMAASVVTEGASVAVQKGFYQVVDAINLFKKPISSLIARGFRSDDHAFEKDVWRGNRGRDAEWKTGKTMYAIVTMPGNLLPLNQPMLVQPNTLAGFTLVPTGDSKAPYAAEFRDYLAAQYIPSEEDTRNLVDSKKLAETNGQAAYYGGATPPPAPVKRKSQSGFLIIPGIND